MGSTVRSEQLSSRAQRALRKTFGYVGMGCVMTAGVTGAIVLQKKPSNWYLWGISLVGAGCGLVAVMEIPKEQKINKHLAWAAFHACDGVLIAPLVQIGFEVAPDIIPRAVGGTALTTLAMSACALVAKDSSFLWLGGPLTSTGLCLLVAGLIEVFVPHSPGPDGSSFLQKMKSLQIYLSLGVFSLSIARDMHRIIQLADMRDFDNASLEEEEVGEEKVDCVRESVNMYVNISGVFVDLIQLLLRDELDKRKKKRDE